MATVKLGSKAVGSIVKIGVKGSTREFIVVHQGLPSSMYDASCNGTWMLMKDIYNISVWNSVESGNYSSSVVHDYINNTLLNLIDSNIKSQIKQIKIPYYNNGLKTGADGLSTKMVLLSAAEVGYGDAYITMGSRLSYFQDGNGTPEKIANYRNSAYGWWLRDMGGTSPNAYQSPLINYVTDDGGINKCGVSVNSGVRPAFILPSSLLVTDDGAIIQNTVPTTPSSISVPGSINGGSTITVSWGASSDSEGNLSGYAVERSTNGGASWEQIYNGAAQSISNYVAFGTPSVIYRVKSYDSEGAQSGWRTSSQVTVINNTAPGTPGGIYIPASIYGDTTITISWDASADAEGNLSGYIAEKSYNGGVSWEQIYNGAARAINDYVPFGTPTVMYRVKAYDNYGLQSDYRTSTQVTVLNNTAPASPASITVPITVDGGRPLTITWGGSSDAENNLAGYSLERQVDGGSWTVIYTGAALSYVDTIIKGWASVAYRVQAYDAYDMRSGYATSATPTRTVNNNTAPTITSTTANGSDLGEKNSDFSVSYTVSDVDNGDTLKVTESLDGVVLRSFTAVSGSGYSLNVTGLTYMRLLK